MREAYTKILELDEFKTVSEQLKLVLTGVKSEELLSKEHGVVEVWINEKTIELARRLMQSHLDLRTKNEQEHETVTGADGIERSKVKRVRKRQLMTLFGEVEVNRLGYGQPSSDSLFPLDAQLNLPQRKYSHGLQQRIADEAARSSFDTTVTSITKTTGGKVPKLQAEQITVDIAQDFESFYQQEVEVTELTNDPLVLSLDGKGIVMRKKYLREATRKAADKEKYKMKTRLSQGEKGNRKRMATVASVYSVERHVRSPDLVMGLEKKEKVKEVRTRNKRVWASVKREAIEVTEEVFQEALRRDITKNRPWVVVVDGQPQQLKNIQSCIKKYQVKNVSLVLDFIHVLEYLWQAAHAFLFKESVAESWVRERALKILNGKVSDVAAGIRRSATLRKLSESARKSVDTCVDYLLKYTHMMKYNQYLAEGYPIASGVIEGACRHLIKDRLDITGARWGLEGAEAVLKLRSLRSSGDFDKYWEFHKAKSHERTHLSLYAQLPLTA